MVIESSFPVTALPPAHTAHRPRSPIMSTIITLTLVGLIFFIISINSKPTGSPLSPLPEGEIAEISTTSPAPTNSTIIAAPAEAVASHSGQTDLKTNAKKQIATLPANTDQLVIRDQTISSNSYVYLTPISAVNDPIFVKTKGEGYFIAAIKKNYPVEIVFEYYVIND